MSQLGLLVKSRKGSDRHLNECFSFLGCCIKLTKWSEGAKIKGLGKHLNKQQIRGMRRKVLFIAKRWLTSFGISSPFTFVIVCMCMKLQLEWVKFWLKNDFHIFSWWPPYSVVYSPSQFSWLFLLSTWTAKHLSFVSHSQISWTSSSYMVKV